MFFCYFEMSFCSFPAPKIDVRIWCIFEIYVCAELSLPLKLVSVDGDLSVSQAALKSLERSWILGRAGRKSSPRRSLSWTSGERMPRCQRMRP